MSVPKDTPKADNQQNDLEILTGEVLPDKQDESIAALEERTEKYRDSRLSERFLSIFAIVILIDMLVFQAMPWLSVLMLTVLELIFLTILGRICGVDDVLVLTERCIAALSKLHGKK